jgi:hypothetical protein
MALVHATRLISKLGLPSIIAYGQDTCKGFYACIASDTDWKLILPMAVMVYVVYVVQI